jgi:hypothetical protein
MQPPEAEHLPPEHSLSLVQLGAHSCVCRQTRSVLQSRSDWQGALGPPHWQAAKVTAAPANSGQRKRNERAADIEVASFKEPFKDTQILGQFRPSGETCLPAT